MWELDYNESWAPKNWCFWTVVLEKTLESHLDCKEIQPVNSKGNQSWIFIGRTDVEAETLILWPPDAKTDSLEKTLMLGKIEGGRRRGRQRMRWLDMSLSKLWEILKDKEAWHASVHGVTKSLTRLSNWTTTTTETSEKTAEPKMLTPEAIKAYVNPDNEAIIPNLYSPILYYTSLHYNSSQTPNPST